MFLKRALEFFLLVVVAYNSNAYARARDTGFLNRTVTVGATTYRYQVYVPSDYTPKKRWPVILFLHGIGERGDDGLRQTEVGIGRAIRLYAERFPSIVVFPQCRRDAAWPGEMEVQALKALDQTVKEFRGDPQRLYLTGLSMGGYGAWAFAALHPGKFAAIVPICGGILPRPGLPLSPEVAAIVRSPDPYA